jgi:hypothetical protein
MNYHYKTPLYNVNKSLKILTCTFCRNFYITI